MGSSSSKGAQTIGFRYFMSLVMGISRGPLDEIVQIDVGDVRAWPLADGDSESIGGLMTVAQGPNGMGVAQYEDGTSEIVSANQINTVSGSGEYQINAENLFGGDKREGGIAGSLRVMMGAGNQIVPTYIKTLIGGRVPDYRGVTTLFFDGLLTSMNPYPKKWEFRVRRTTAGWDGDVWQPSLAAIWMRNGTIKGMNGAHILYEAFTNRDWGRGLSRDWIDEVSWLKVAQTLYNEGYGLCLRYNRQSELSAFIQEVVDHIGGSIYPDRSTGRLVLSLLRDDYDVEDVPLFTHDTGLISLDDVETASQEDLINEVIVKWTDPISKTERSARVQNLALNQSMGASNSTTRNYAGVADVELALRMCQRDLEANSNSLKRFTVVLDRRAWRLSPGMVFKVSVPERGIFNAILRAGKVTEMGGSDGRIKVQAGLDVYGLPFSSFIAAQPQEWVAPNRTAMIADKSIVREATYAELVRSLDSANLNILSPLSGLIGVIAGRPSSLNLGYDVQVTPMGASRPNSGSGTFAPFVVSNQLMPITDVPFTVSYDDFSDLGLIEVGLPVHFGNEIGRLEAIDDNAKTITVSRGCFDTVPSAHAPGTVFFFARDEIGSDGIEYVNGDSLSVQVLPFTSTNRLAESLAPVINLDVVARQGRPYPPARVMVNGVHYGSLTRQSGNVVITWAHRDRIIQQDQLISHNESSIGPEAGTTYTIRVYNGETLVRTVNGLSGTTWTYTSNMRVSDGIESEATFELESTRDGMTSFMRYRFLVEYDISGYGVSGYGDAYGI